MTDLEWVPDSESSAQLQRKPDRDCIWKRFSRSEARALFRGRHLLLAGDSTLGYQYLALIMFLQGMDLAADGPREWILYQAPVPPGYDGQKFFNEYYTNTSRALGEDEVCDCYREFKCHPLCKPQTYVQTRHFRLEEDSYITVVPLGGKLIFPRGHNMDFEEWKLNCAAVPCDHPADWVFPYGCYLDILKGLVQHFNPDIFVNGLENHMIQPYEWLIEIIKDVPDHDTIYCGMNWLDFSARLTEEIGVTSGGTKGRPLVLTRSNNANTSTLFQIYEGEKTASPTIAPPSLLLYDIEYITELLSAPPLNAYPYAAMIDEVHVQPWVNFEMNMLLLNVIAQRLNR